MPQFKDISGLKFTRLRVLEVAQKASRNPKQTTKWRCVCDCGNTCLIAPSKLYTGSTKSCGCLADDNRRAAAKHGMAGTPEYKAWTEMKGRCLNSRNKRFEYYGGRGIQIHEPWVQNFSAFYAAIGPRPTAKHSLDRIDVNGNYVPGNIRWATPLVQSANRRCVALFTSGEVTKTVRQWAVHLGLDYKLVNQRINRGRSTADALGIQGY